MLYDDEEKENIFDENHTEYGTAVDTYDDEYKFEDVEEDDRDGQYYECTYGELVDIADYEEVIPEDGAEYEYEYEEENF